MNINRDVILEIPSNEFIRHVLDPATSFNSIFNFIQKIVKMKMSCILHRYLIYIYKSNQKKKQVVIFII